MTDYVDEKAIREKAQREWDSFPSTREEFTSFDAFLAYRLAKANGQVVFLGKRK